MILSVLILDEPTDGLDPNQKHEVRGLIKTMARDKAIILSTHVLEEVHAVCTRAMIIAKGKVITDGTPAELEARSRWHNAVILRLRGPRHRWRAGDAARDARRQEGRNHRRGPGGTGISDLAERRATDHQCGQPVRAPEGTGMWSSCPWTGGTWMKCFAR